MIIATVNAKRITDLIKRFPDETKGEMDKFLDKNVRSLISSSGRVPGLVQVTPPFSQGVAGTAAKKQGEAAVTRDIWRVYASPGKVYELLRSYAGEPEAARWWKMWKTDKRRAIRYLELSSPGAIQAMKVGFDGGAEHQRRRGRNGRVNGQRPSRIVLNDMAAVKRYARVRMRMVGLLASAIPAAAGSRFGTLNGVPAWVKRHSNSYGYVRESKGRGKRTVFLGITNGAIRDMQRRFTYVVRYRLGAMQREMPFVARALEKKLASRLR